MIAWATDLHLDHAPPQQRDALLTLLRKSDAGTVILTGDLSVGRRLVADLEALASAAARPVWFVLGNHDHYGSSIGSIRDHVIEMANETANIRWLPPAGVVALDAETALVGIDGWADGAFGDPLGTPVVLNDDRWIAELAAQPTRAGKVAVKRELARADAIRLGVLLQRAASDFSRLVVATHVPPFPEVLPRRGHLAGPEWLPVLICGATGAELLAFARTHPDHQFEVLAGHTHVAADVRLAANLRCRVGAARYGEPGLQELTV
jgi:3',5'-cyclic-AMP phosphodiesterase